jgi:phosphoribosylformimino-5-aminoimidazole carboxamide ribotide isomerase
LLVIPVIDLIGGRVVHAKHGDRTTYVPLNSPLCPSSNPIRVTEAYLSLYPFEYVYIADLDAIEGRGNNRQSILSVLENFSSLKLWVDAGIRDQVMLEMFITHKNIYPVIGSETLTELKLLEKSHSPILSLDYRNGNFLGPKELEADVHLWPYDVIVMSLSSIGGQLGPDLKLFQRLQSRSPESCFYAAGGVRNIDDLQKLANSYCKGALVASALHNGALKTNDLQNIIQAPETSGT